MTTNAQEKLREAARATGDLCRAGRHDTVLHSDLAAELDRILGYSELVERERKLVEALTELANDAKWPATRADNPMRYAMLERADALLREGK